MKIIVIKKELYFDSLDEKEIKEQFKMYIDNNINVESDEFKEICKKYGYIPNRFILTTYMKVTTVERNIWIIIHN